MSDKTFDRIAVVCLLFATIAALAAIAVAAVRVRQLDREQDLAAERDIYASRAVNWEAAADQWQATAGLLQAELDQQQADAARQAAESPSDGAVTLEYAGTFELTANCCEAGCAMCGGTGVTASGAPQTPGVTAGASFATFPAGTWIYVEGIGIRQVQDTGPGCPANHIDIAVDTHAEALAWPYQGEHRVWIIKTEAEDAAD